MMTYLGRASAAQHAARQKMARSEEASISGSGAILSPSMVDTASQAPSRTCGKPRPKALFCYALVRTPNEPTGVMLGKQLAAACDGWALFSNEADPANNIIKAFDSSVLIQAYNHQMREMVVDGVWKYLSQAGTLDEYEWVLKLDSDAFVRPTMLRKAFQALHTSCSRHVASVADDEDRGYIDGPFVAIRADVALGIKSLGWPHECDHVLSGHDQVEPPSGNGRGKNDERCLRQLNVASWGTLRDSEGKVLLALDQNPAADMARNCERTEDKTTCQIAGPPECEDISKVLLEHKRKNIEGPMCKCTTLMDRSPECLSEDWVFAHHVKDPDVYAELVEAFP